MPTYKEIEAMQTAAMHIRVDMFLTDELDLELWDIAKHWWNECDIILNDIVDRESENVH